MPARTLMTSIMRIRFTLFLLAANLVVFGLIWKGLGGREESARTSELLFPLDPDRIELVSSDPARPGYALVKKSSKWLLESPYSWPADEWTAQKIAEELRFVSAGRGFSPEEAEKLGNNLASYGLDKPAFTLTVSSGEGETARATSVKIGSLSPDGKSGYLLTADSKTILSVPDTVLTTLMRKPEEIRRRSLFSIDPFEVRAITLNLPAKDDRPGQTVGLVRGKRATPGRDDPEFIWRFETPTASDAETAVVERELEALSEVSFVRFLQATPELLAETGFATPGMTVSLDGNKRKQTLLVGLPDPDSKGENLYVKFEDSQVVLTMPAAALKPWVAVRTLMRDRRLIRFDPDTVTGVTVHEGGSSLVIHRIDKPEPGKPAKPEWLLPLVPGSTATEVTPVDLGELDRMLAALGNLSALRMDAPASLPREKRFLCEAFVTDEPTQEQLESWKLTKNSAYKRRVDLAFRDGSKRMLIIAGPSEAGTPFHAKFDDAPTVFSIAPGVLDTLSVTPSAYRKRTLLAAPAGARAASLKITDLATGRTLLDENKPDDVPDWETFLAGRTAGEREEILTLAALTGRVTAARFVDENRQPARFSENYSYDEGAGLPPEKWRYRLDWTLKLPQGTGTVSPVRETLYFTRRIGGSTQVAGSPRENLVFALTRDWIDALHPLTFARDSLPELPKLPAPGAAEGPPSR